ncbi:MAG: polymer-forming cytoskeletal protein [Patescibacteria group bacterium]
MFNAQTRDSGAPLSAETFIGPSVKLEGNFSGEGDVVIEGMLVGNLVTKGDVRIGTNAVIEAQVQAKNANIAGKVRGNIIANLLKLTATASIQGDIKTMALSIEEGAVVNGKITMSREKLDRGSEAPVDLLPEKPKVIIDKLREKTK